MKNIRKNNFFSLIIDNNINAYFVNINEIINVFNILNKANIV